MNSGKEKKYTDLADLVGIEIPENQKPGPSKKGELLKRYQESIGQWNKELVKFIIEDI